MTIADLRAELSMRAIEFEQALDKGLPHAELIKIYRDIKELQYKLTVEEVNSMELRAPDHTIIE